MRAIVFLTDFGIRDGYHGVMKGVALGIAPQATLIDLTHHVDPQNVQQAGLLLAEHAFFFPPGTIFVAVVDPGVGTSRRALAAAIGDFYFIAPDNGLLTRVLAHGEQQGWRRRIVEANQPQYWRPTQSRTFHGRDIFTPLAAHLATGIALDALGDPIDDPVRLAIPQPSRRGASISGEVQHIDHFGNLETNIPGALLEGLRGIRLHIAGRTIEGLTPSFGYDRGLIALIDSNGQLGIALTDGSAQALLDCSPGEHVRVDYLPPGDPHPDP